MDVERNIKISLIEDPTADAPGHLTLDVENESLVNQSGTVGHRKENWTSNIHHLQFFFIYEMLVEACGCEIHGFDWGQLKSRPFHTSFDIFSSCFSTEPNEWAHHIMQTPIPHSAHGQSSGCVRMTPYWPPTPCDWSSSGDAWCAWCLWPAAKARVKNQIVGEVDKVLMS